MANTTTKDAAQTALAPAPTGSTALTIGSDAYRGALEPHDPNTAWTLAQELASVGMFGLRNPAEGLAKIMYGRSIGVGTMQSLQRLHNIEGKIGVDAELLHALCLRSPLCEYFDPVLDECDETKATFVAKRIGRPEMRNTFTVERAEKMGVLERGKDDESKKKNNWQTQRRRMLMARCRSELAHMVFPDVVGGLYTTDELRDIADENEMQGEVVPAQADAPIITIQAAKRDYAGEAQSLIERVQAAKSRQERAAVRAAIEAWDGVEPFLGQVRAAYNATKPSAAAAAAAPAAEAPSTTAAAPAPMPAGNLFSGQATEAKE